MLDIKVDIKGMKDIANAVAKIPMAAQDACKRAEKKTADNAKVYWAREIGKDLNLLARDIKAAVILNRKPNGMLVSADSTESPNLGTKPRLRPIGLIKFRGTREIKGKGVSAKIKKGGGRIRLKHAFIRTVGGGHRGVFQRIKGVPRLPIKEMYSTSVENVGGDTLPQTKDFAQEKLAVNARRQLLYELHRRGVRTD